MSKGRPFFAINDDDNNPINKLTANLLGKGGRQGKQKGDSRSTIPGTNFRYPKGFTPPVDFYTDEPKRDLKDAVNTPKPSAAGARSRAVAGVDSRNLGGGFKRDTSSKFLNSETGLHVEYGNSLLVDGYLRANKKTSGAPATTKIQGIATGRFPNIVINPNDFSPDKFYTDDQSIHDGQFKNITQVGTANTENFVPIEYGFAIRNDPSTAYKTENWVNNRRYFLSHDNQHSLRFTHLLDYYLGPNDKEGADPSGDRTNYLSEPEVQQFDWSRTFDENEDPTILGVDLKIKGNSPLLNGEIEEFIKSFQEYGELSSRLEIFNLFKTQLLKFFDTDQSISLQTDAKKNKAYYLQGISGLDNLVESTGSDGKYFIDFGKDVITLEFLEDVTQNMGYLSSLYKTMSYSRLHGKDLIPRNLLRFDIDITITEMRPFLRSIHQRGDSEILKKMNREGNDEIHTMRDEISRYTYTLYECRFLFDKMPHGDEVKNGEANFLPNFKLSFDYKYSTLNFKKYKGFIKYNTDGKPYIEYFGVNNRIKQPLQLNEKTIQNNQIVDGETLKTFVGYYSDVSADVPKLPLIQSNYKQEPYESDPKEFYSDTTFDKVYFVGTEQLSGRESTALLFNARRNEDISNASNSQKPSFLNRIASNLKANKVFDQLKSGLINAAATEINQRILSQAALLNKTIDNIRNNAGLGRMSEPTNVYLPKSPFESAIRNTLRNAIGGSVKSFFQSL